MSQTLKYPDYDKKNWGPHYWYTFHENASLYPDQPSTDDIQNERQYVNHFVTHLPCNTTCGDTAKTFIQNNPPDLTNKKAYFVWTVQFHNEINKETGSEERIDNPNDLLGTTQCDTCKLSGGDTSSGAKQNDSIRNEVSHDADVKFSDSIKSYKQSVRDLVNAAYEKEGLEAQEIVFNKCPDGTDTSCAIVIKNKDGTQRHLTYYKPHDLVKTLFHEVDHHIGSKKRGEIINDSYNDNANKYADSMIQKYFPLDQVLTDRDGNIQVAHDIIIKGESMPIPNRSSDPATMVSEVYGTPNQFSQNPEDPNILSEFPHLKQTLMEIKKEELKNEIREFEGKGGILSHFDKVYEWPAEMTGLKADQLNLLHTPTIIANVTSTLTASFLSPLTSTLFTTLFGIVLMLLGVGFHKRMTTRDIQLIQALGSQLMWGNSIPALNPKKARKIKKDFDRFADKVTKKDFHIGDLVEMPENEGEGFKPMLEHPDFEGAERAFSGRKGRPIRKGRLKTDNYGETRNSSLLGSMRSDAVIKLPPYTSVSHSRFV
jgi:hypothetical protein